MVMIGPSSNWKFELGSARKNGPSVLVANPPTRKMPMPLYFRLPGMVNRVPTLAGALGATVQARGYAGARQGLYQKCGSGFAGNQVEGLDQYRVERPWHILESQFAYCARDCASDHGFGQWQLRGRSERFRQQGCWLGRCRHPAAVGPT
jgi:hypothetical protein